MVTCAWQRPTDDTTKFVYLNQPLVQGSALEAQHGYSISGDEHICQYSGPDAELLTRTWTMHYRYVFSMSGFCPCPEEAELEYVLISSPFQNALCFTERHQVRDRCTGITNNGMRKTQTGMVYIEYPGPDRCRTIMNGWPSAMSVQEFEARFAEKVLGVERVLQVLDPRWIWPNLTFIARRHLHIPFLRRSCSKESLSTLEADSESCSRSLFGSTP